MRGQKLDVSASEMMELRRQGYSNRDIANMLDICVQTVRNHIGRQDGHMENLAAFKDKPKKKAAAAPAEEVIPTYVPRVMKEIYSICNGDIEANIEHDVELITITYEDMALCVTYEQARELVQFLAWASARCKPRGGGDSGEKHGNQTDHI